MQNKNIRRYAQYARGFGLAATVVTIGITARFGWLQGEDLITSVCYAAGLGMASFFVGYGLVLAWASHKAKLPHFITAAACLVFVISVAVELTSHLGATASARSHDMTKASDATNIHNDKRAELERARADLAAMKPTRTPAAISAEMQGIESRPWFASVAACADPAKYGSYGNSCRRYVALKGELATSQARAALDARVQKLTAEASTSSTGHSLAAAQSAALAQYATWNTRPTQDETVKTNMALQLLLALYFVAIGLVNLVGHALDEALNDEAEAKPTADIVFFKAPSVGTAHVGPTSGPMIPASLKVANG